MLHHLRQALPEAGSPAVFPLAGGSLRVRQPLLLTLLFLGAVGLHRTWDLRGYTADGLALLTGRKRAYGYRFTQSFLSQIAGADGAESLTNALAVWTTQLWHPVHNGPEPQEELTCYVDGHRKPVYSDVRLPRGLVGRLGSVLGCRALVLLHDEDGHPLLATTHRGDQHLTVGLPSIVTRYEQATKTSHVKRIIVDREGMATEFLVQLQAEGRAVVTILRSNQYQDLASFSQVGTFAVLSTGPDGQLVREVAPACIRLRRPDHPGEVLDLQVALIRDLRRFSVVEPLATTEADPAHQEPACLQDGWRARAAPTAQMTPKLIPIVTTASHIDAVELAQTYIQRWPRQENVIKDYLRPLGMDTNHGFAKTPVENSEVLKRRRSLQQRLSRLKTWELRARSRGVAAQKRRERLQVQRQKRSEELYKQLKLDQKSWQEQGMTDQEMERQRKKRLLRNHEEMVQFRPKECKADEQCANEGQKRDRSCQEQQEVLRALEELDARTQSMYELDPRKDQMMTVCKVALTNLTMWVRDQYFPASYAHATWKRLAPFFQLPGIISLDAMTVRIELRPFNDRALNRDLALLCERVNEAAPCLPDGRVLSMVLSAPGCILAAQKHRTIP